MWGNLKKISTRILSNHCKDDEKRKPKIKDLSSNSALAFWFFNIKLNEESTLEWERERPQANSKSCVAKVSIRKESSHQGCEAAGWFKDVDKIGYGYGFQVKVNHKSEVN